LIGRKVSCLQLALENSAGMDGLHGEITPGDSRRFRRPVRLLCGI
jgi:hypothetical protein